MKQENKNILFLTDSNHFSSKIYGGVQICSQEFFNLLQLTHFEISVLEVSPTKSLLTKIKRRLLIDNYDYYDDAIIAHEIKDFHLHKKIYALAVNQIALLPAAIYFNQKYKQSAKIILLSHGNETGDYIGQILSKPFNFFQSYLHSNRLGKMLIKEASMLSRDVDLTLVMSEQERVFDQWLGADNIVLIPRIFSPAFLSWNPTLGRVGFVGTLNHLPNFSGIDGLCQALEHCKLPPNFKFHLVGSGEKEGQAFASKFSFVNYLGHLTDTALNAEASTWTLFLNPVFQLSRGASTKLATGINWGLPLLSTPFGNRGYEWNNGSIPTFLNPNAMVKAIVDNAWSKENLMNLAEQTKLVAASGPSLQELAERVEKALIADS